MRIANKKRFAISMLIILILTIFLYIMIDFIRFPEVYLTTQKYQLMNDIKRGDKLAIEYYEDNYVKNGRELF